VLNSHHTGSQSPASKYSPFKTIPISIITRAEESDKISNI
jgi:hypothetical protein